MNNRKEQLLNFGDKTELFGYKLVFYLIHRLFDGFFIYKKRKATIVAGSVTFFAILSFCPILLLLISGIEFFVESGPLAQSLVMKAVKVNFPALAPWILKSIESITKAQLTNSFNWLNLIILLYASLGFCSSIQFGIFTISMQERKGGFLIEDLKSIFDGVFVALFIVIMVIFLPDSPLLQKMKTDMPTLYGILAPTIKYQVFHSAMSIGFFTLYYKWISPIKIRFSDAFIGGISFIILFTIGKTFYWVYLHYVKDDLMQSFGNFYTLVVAITWIYFLMCSFFYGASVACAPVHKRKTPFNYELQKLSFLGEAWNSFRGEEELPDEDSEEEEDLEEEANEEEASPQGPIVDVPKEEV